MRTITLSYCIKVDWTFNSLFLQQSYPIALLAWPQHITQMKSCKYQHQILCFSLWLWEVDVYSVYNKPPKFVTTLCNGTTPHRSCCTWLELVSWISVVSASRVRLQEKLKFRQPEYQAFLKGAGRGGSGISILKHSFSTHCVRRVNAALVTDAGRLSPLMISRQIFLFITWKKEKNHHEVIRTTSGQTTQKNYEPKFSPLTSTSPPFSTTSLNSLNKSNVCFAIIGTLFTGVPENQKT